MVLVYCDTAIYFDHIANQVLRNSLGGNWSFGHLLNFE